jgi:hypothetical protein
MGRSCCCCCCHRRRLLLLLLLPPPPTPPLLLLLLLLLPPPPSSPDQPLPGLPACFRVASTAGHLGAEIDLFACPPLSWPIEWQGYFPEWCATSDLC